MNSQIENVAKPVATTHEALAPIRRLMTAAMICALLAVCLLVSSAYHVMETTDAAEMVRERERASAIADIVAYDAVYATPEAIVALGKAGGLKGLALQPVASADPEQQSMPLLKGSSSGQFLTWTTDRPGRALFAKFAPIRLPIGIGLIGIVLGTLVLMMRLIRRIERQRHQAEQQALRDHLTGLPNRLALESELSRLSAAKTDFSLLAMDLDNFKPINDLFGHHVGDVALAIVSKRLLTQMRPGDMLARMGGDEFVAIVHRQGKRDELAELAQDCITVVSEPMPEAGIGISVGVSIGVVTDARAYPPSALLTLADRALYDAKETSGTYRFAGEMGVLRGLRA